MSRCRSSAPRLTEASDPHALLKLPFSVFVCSIARLLVHLRYEEVSIKKPIHRTGKGRNSQGGFDIEAYHHDGLTHSRVIAQVKQHTHTIPRSCVDELRGAMVRSGALQGLLFTAGTFSPAAVEAARHATNSLPVRLIDGAELARLLVAKEVSIRAETPRTQPLAAPATQTDAQGDAPSTAQPILPPAAPLPVSPPSMTITLTIGSPEERRDNASR